eukprot:NODE_158_length_15065_cov_0.349125.p11 type:complete len:209 gc:universal NODE_158_length_15065_cov_0.349125:13863-13237(-)
MHNLLLQYVNNFFFFFKVTPCDNVKITLYGHLFDPYHCSIVPQVSVSQRGVLQRRSLAKLTPLGDLNITRGIHSSFCMLLFNFLFAVTELVIVFQGAFELDVTFAFEITSQEWKYSVIDPNKDSNFMTTNGPMSKEQIIQSVANEYKIGKGNIIMKLNGQNRLSWTINVFQSLKKIIEMSLTLAECTNPENSDALNEFVAICGRALYK